MYFNHAHSYDDEAFCYLGHAHSCGNLRRKYPYKGQCCGGVPFGYGFVAVFTKTVGQGNNLLFTTKINAQMEILNEEEARDIIPLTKGRETLLSAKLKELKVGQALVVTPKDWKTKSSPYRVANNIAKRHGRQFEQGRMPDGSGWVFKRVG